MTSRHSSVGKGFDRSEHLLNFDDNEKFRATFTSKEKGERDRRESFYFFFRLESVGENLRREESHIHTKSLEKTIIHSLCILSLQLTRRHLKNTNQEKVLLFRHTRERNFRTRKRFSSFNTSKDPARQESLHRLKKSKKFRCYPFLLLLLLLLGERDFFRRETFVGSWRKKEISFLLLLPKLAPQTSP